MCDFGRGKFLPPCCGCCVVSSFTSGGRRMSSPADTSVLILPPSLWLFFKFFFGGRHFNESVILLSFRYFEAVSLHPLPSFLWNVNALQSEPKENRNALHKKGWGSPSVMFSNLNISSSIKLYWNPGSGCGFIWGHGSSGKTVLFQLLTYWGGALPETTRDEIS